MLLKHAGVLDHIKPVSRNFQEELVLLASLSCMSAHCKSLCALMDMAYICCHPGRGHCLLHSHCVGFPVPSMLSGMVCMVAVLDCGECQLGAAEGLPFLCMRCSPIQAISNMLHLQLIASLFLSVCMVESQTLDKPLTTA